MKWASLNASSHPIEPVIPAGEQWSITRTNAVRACIDWALYGAKDHECLAVAKRIQRDWGFTNGDVMRMSARLRLTPKAVEAVMAVFEGDQ